MRIRTKLILANLLIASFVFVVGLVAFYTANEARKSYQTLTDHTLPVVQELDEIKVAGLHIVSSTSEFGFIRAELNYLQQQDSDESYENDDEQEEQELLEYGSVMLYEALEKYHMLTDSKVHKNEDYNKKTWSYNS